MAQLGMRENLQQIDDGRRQMPLYLMPYGRNANISVSYIDVIMTYENSIFK